MWHLLGKKINNIIRRVCNARECDCASLIVEIASAWAKNINFKDTQRRETFSYSYVYSYFRLHHRASKNLLKYLLATGSLSFQIIINFFSHEKVKKKIISKIIKLFNSNYFLISTFLHRGDIIINNTVGDNQFF